MSGRTAGRCDYFAKAVREAAHADRQIAAAHLEMAKTAKPYLRKCNLPFWRKSQSAAPILPACNPATNQEARS
jgi:hypothetical protein